MVLKKFLGLCPGTYQRQFLGPVVPTKDSDDFCLLIINWATGIAISAFNSRRQELLSTERIRTVECSLADGLITMWSGY